MAFVESETSATTLEKSDLIKKSLDSLTYLYEKRKDRKKFGKPFAEEIGLLIPSIKQIKHSGNEDLDIGLLNPKHNLQCSDLIGRSRSVNSDKILNGFKTEYKCSHQSRFHENCFPHEDPSLIIGHPCRRISRTKSAPIIRKRRKASLNSSLNERESVTNLVYSGPEEEEKDSWNKLSKLIRKTKSSRIKMANIYNGSWSHSGENENYQEYELVTEIDSSRITLNSEEVNKTNRHKDRSKYPTAFVYQMTSFDHVSRNTPGFVRANSHKIGRFTTETFILKLNQLRRRRALGDPSLVSKKRGNKSGDGQSDNVTT